MRLACLVTLVAWLVTHHPASLFRLTMRAPPMTMWTPHFVVCSHDYEHVDLLCMAREARRWYGATGIRTAFVVADRAHNHFFCSAIHGDACIPVRGGTTQQILDMLRTHVVCMFVYRGTVGTGAYHVCRHLLQTNVVVARIRTPGVTRRTLEAGDSVWGVVASTFGREFHVDYVAPPPLTTTAPEYMERLKAALYEDFSESTVE